MTGYQGPLFNTVFIDKKVPKSPKIRELIFWGQMFSDLNLAPSYGKGSHGNLSFRYYRGCVITATLTDLKKLSPDDFVEVVDCRKAGKEMTVYCRGRRKPSTDAFVHFQIYKLRDDVNSIFHGHDSLVMEQAHRLNIARTHRQRESGSYELFLGIKRILGRRNYLVVKDHGILSLGRNNVQAGRRALRVHELAAKKSG